MTDNLVNIHNLSFNYKKSISSALDSISFTVAPGESLGLIGINGAGKTTLVSLITGLLKPSSGSITIAGTPAQLGRKDVSLVPQEFAFYEKLSTRENLDYFSGILKLSGKNKQRTIDSVIKTCNLEALANTPSHRYSGGEKRRLNFAIALLKPCKLLILDEPTANVDPHSRALILDIIQQQHQAGTAIIYTSHLLSEVQGLCESVALIHNSQLKLHENMKKALSESRKQLVIELPQNKLHALPEYFSIVDGCAIADPDSIKRTPAALIQELEDFGLNPVSISYGKQSLEALFMKLTNDSSLETTREPI